MCPEGPRPGVYRRPELELGFAQDSDDGMDQTPAVDPAEPDPIPRYELDRTRSW